MFLELNNGSILNVTKISSIIFEDLSITYRLINGGSKTEVFSDESSFNEKVNFIKSKLVVS